MAMKCDICGEDLHYIKDQAVGKVKIVRCSLEPYKKVSSFYTPEFRGILSSVSFEEDDIILSKKPEGLKAFSELVPEESPLLDLIKFYNSCAYTQSQLIESSLYDFFFHFNRVLIDIYYRNRVHYIDCTQQAESEQFNYLWLTPTKLRECYFHQGTDRFNTMSDLSNPSLVIYPIGSVMSYDNKAWGDIVLDLITNRRSEGKATWIVQSKSLDSCVEMTNDLKSFLKSISKTKISDLGLGTEPVKYNGTNKGTTGPASNSYL